MNNIPLVNLHNNGRLIYLFTRDKNGNLDIQKKNSFFPYYYETSARGEFRSYDGKNLQKVYVTNPRDVAKNRSNNAYEADIIFTRRYMIDKISEIEKTNVKYAFLDIEVLTEELPDVNKAEKPITCISVYNSYDKKISTFYLEDYENEYNLLEDFIRYMREEKFDLLMGWNMQFFDYPYLYNRIPDFAKKISPIGEERYGNGSVYYPAGVSIIDYLTWFKSVTMNREEQYSLDYIAQKYLGEEPCGEFDFSKLTEKIKIKNINDVNRMVKLEEIKKIIPYFDEIRRLSKVEWEDLIWNSRILDVLLLEEAKKQNIALPMKPSEERGTLTDKEEFAGAFREAFETGSFFGVGKYDLSSCYPAMIIDFCLDPSNIVLPDTTGNEDIMTIEDTEFRQRPTALLPTVTKKLIALKTNIKKKLSAMDLKNPEHENVKKMYDAVKSIVNSAYGVFGNRFFRLYNRRVASATTYLARSLLKYVIEELKKENYEVIYADTDGIMVKNNTEDISGLLNTLVKKWYKETYGKENLTSEFTYEGYYEKLVILAKCRYLGYLKTDKGVEEEMKGIEAKRKDSTVYMKKFQRTLLDKILNKETKEQVMTWLRNEIKNFKNNSLEDIAFPCKLGKKLEDYVAIPIFVRALGYAQELTKDFNKRIGDKYSYVYVISNEYEEKIISKTLIQTYNKKGDKKGFKNLTDKRIETACNNNDIKIKEDKDVILEGLMEKKLVKVENVEIKGKNKNVMAFDENSKLHVKNVDWELMLARNITNKSDVIFTAMKWDMGEINDNTK